MISKTNIYTTALRLEKENEQLKRLVNLLSIPDTFQYRLYQRDWDYFRTIAFKNDLNQEASYHQMLRAADYLIERYGTKIKLRIFFTVEPFLTEMGIISISF